MALASPMPDGRGFLLAYQTTAEIEARAAVFSGSLVGAAVVTLLWTCALLTMVVYLVLTRFHDEVESEQKQAATETLRRTQNLVRTRDAVIFGLAKLAGTSEPEPSGRMAVLSEACDCRPMPTLPMWSLLMNQYDCKVFAVRKTLLSRPT